MYCTSISGITASVDDTKLGPENGYVRQLVRYNVRSAIVELLGNDAAIMNVIVSFASEAITNMLMENICFCHDTMNSPNVCHCLSTQLYMVSRQSRIYRAGRMCFTRPCPVSSRSACAHVMHVQASHYSCYKLYQCVSCEEPFR